MTVAHHHKEDLLALIQSLAPKAWDLNYTLAKNPEVSSHEFQSVKRIGALLESEGIPVTYEFAGIPTAFKASVVKADKSLGKLAILCEYDALPELGHACGHCASGSLSVLAGLALAKLSQQAPLTMDIDIIGTPDEEATGCKVDMTQQGIFKDYDFAIMVHMDGTITRPTSNFLALDCYRVRYHGKPAHAAGEPWAGINAVNGVQLAIHALDMIRQQCKPESRIGTWIINGGTASNIIPDFGEFEVTVRHTKRSYLNKLSEQCKKIFEGAALCTGTKVDYEFYGNPYDDMNNIEEGMHLIEEVMEDLGIPFTPGMDPASGSSDIGNVSYQCPAYHPTLRLEGDEKVCHTKGFAAAMLDPRIEGTITKGASIIALTLLSLMEEPAQLETIKAAFERSLSMN